MSPTEEEKEKAKRVAQEILAERKTSKATKSVNIGRNTLFFVGGLNLLMISLFYFLQEIPFTIDIGISFVVPIIFIGLGFLAIQRPQPALYMGLSLFVLITILDFVVLMRLNITSIFSRSFFITLLLIAALRSKNAKTKVKQHPGALDSPLDHED